MHLPNKVEESIKEHSLDASPKEACGLIISLHRSHELKAFRCQNISDSPENHFEISPKSYVRASRTGKVIAMYHSHPKGTGGFSEFDISVSDNHGIKSILFSVEKDSFEEYEPSDYKSNLWTKKPDPSTFTCFKAVIDFYREVLSIDITKNTKELQNLRGERTLRKNIEILDENEFYKKEGFSPIHSGPIEKSLTLSPWIVSCQGETEGEEILLKKYDVIALKYFDITAHLLIYLGDNKVFHHPRYGYPRIEQLSNPMKQRARGIVRHTNFA